MKIVVVGATGLIGTHLTERLVRSGHDVVALARSADSVAAGGRATAIAASITDTAALTRAFRGADAVVVAAGINREIGEQTYRWVHVDGIAAVIGAARATDVLRVVLLSFLRARPGGPSAYHRSKWAAEELLRGSGLDWTVVKPGVVYGPGDHLVEHTTRALHSFPLFGLVGLRPRSLRPLAADDLARVLEAAATGDPRLRQRTVAVVGPDELSLRDVVERIAAASGRRARCVPLPVWLHRLLARLWEETMVVPLVARSQVEILAEGAVAPSQRVDRLPDDLVPRTPFSRSSIAAALPSERRFTASDLRCALLRAVVE